MATTAAGIESLRTTAVTLEQQVDRFSLKSAPDTRLIPSTSTRSSLSPHSSPHNQSTKDASTRERVLVRGPFLYQTKYLFASPESDSLI